MGPGAEDIELDPNKKHFIEIVVDRLVKKDYGKKYVELPDGITLKSLSCVIYNNDSSTTDNPLVRMYRFDSGSAAEFLFEVQSNGDDGNKQTILDNTVFNSGRAKVDNSTYQYYLKYDPPSNTDTAGTHQRLYDCKIEYVY